jgi:glucosamine--fructose-6-phosphate aminotransferase (isomerizing)
MCGIFGYMGNDNALFLCIEGLKKLEYRGYDSSGIAGVKDNKIFICKEIGNVSMLERAIQQFDIELHSAIAHTRWATHGKPSVINAHPQLDEHQTLAIVHNGVIENYALLRAMLKEKGVLFSSETDTEVIAQLIAYHYQGDFLRAVRVAIAQLEGSYAIAVIHKDHPDRMIAVAKDSPLIIGFAKAGNEFFIASDSNAFSREGLELYYLANGEMADLKKGAPPAFFNRSGESIDKIGKHHVLIENAISKEQFEHFMLKEIFEQVRTIKDAFINRFDEERKTAYFEEIKFDLEELKKIEHIIILACGTSYHAACIAAYLLESSAHVSSRAEIASEFRYRDSVIFPNTLVIALSQSGETADTLAAVRLMKGKNTRILALCNIRGSTLEREADATILLKAGPEVAVASTKTFTSQLTVLYLITLLFARLRGLEEEQARLLFKKLYEIPAQVIEVLNHAGEVEAIAKKYAHYENFFFLGRGILYPTALEAALKLKEVSYINAAAYPAGEMKHGPIALLGPKVPVVIFCANKRLQPKIMSNLMESKARGAPIIVFGWKEFKGEIAPVANDVVWIPKTSDSLAPILLSVAAQLFAYYTAKERGASIDQPRNLAKSVTVE